MTAGMATFGTSLDRRMSSCTIPDRLYKQLLAELLELLDKETFGTSRQFLMNLNTTLGRWNKSWD